MAHTYYTHQDEVDFYRRSKQETPLPVSQSTRSEGQQELSDGSSSRVSPAAELDGKNRPLPPRRRIQVACGRCRKRKIKCSGDPGDGQGCSNCRSSGTPNCQFLRVNSSEVHTKTSYSGWPYPAVHAISSSGSQLGNFTKTSALSTNSPTLRAASYSRQSGYDLGTAGQQNAFTRTQYPLTYNINYEEDPSAMFNIQSPAYMLPNANSSVMNGGPYSDQDSASPMGQPAYPYITPSSHVPPPSTDIPSLFPAITSLSSSCQGSDRTLPNPTSRCQVLSSPPTSLTTLPESLSLSGLSFSPGQSYKAGNHWGPKSTSSTSSEASTGTMSSSSGGSSASSVNGTKTVSSSAQDMVFGYITSSSSPPSLSSNTYRGADMVDPADGFQTGTDSGLTRTMSRESESLLSLGGCSPSIYGYSTGEKSKRRSDGANSGSSGTLMNGLPYIRLPQSEHHNPSPFNILQSDAVTDAHRTSISSLSNPGGY